ncbi:right-handed parallel beta-helix repeat-containing protein [Cellulophaga baltica]|uniref:right-handed parallel beta-helix repeat-containing protein n=1 Tax=Cellulophaga baltica TaxID=76594 RepID=UPI002495131B|nr:right-handed parallel beta-helix repeat-containing protein [Cellulophaga baltica]
MRRLLLIPFLVTFLIGNSSSCKKDTDFIAEVIEAELLEEEVIEEIIPEEEEGEVSEPESPEEDTPTEDSNDTTLKKNQGSSYCGPYTISEPLVLTGLKDTILTGLDISNPSGHAITLTDCSNVVIKQSYFHNSSGNGINIVSSSNITIENNRFETVATAVYAQMSQGIKVLYNDVKNVVGPFPRGQMAQLANCTGSGNKINYNVVENIVGESYAEDAINLYKSSGTSSSPIEIIGNWVRGGGPSGSGGGIMTGDNGGSYVIVSDNILVNPGQYGIAIAGGTNIKIYDNVVYAKEQTFTNVGVYIWNQSPTISCQSNQIYNNKVCWTNKQGYFNAAWNSENCGTVIGWDENTWDTEFNGSILPETILSDCNN